jgi:peptidoglycan hydrolase-like protein with peptidoglycan-binding domain
MKTSKIDAQGRWLRSDAAASYRRMRAAGMPTGGIVTAGRTYAEQKALYDAYRAGKGNLAARPGSSLHESGLAMDITRRTAAQIWAVLGSDPMKVKTGEKIRARDFGWRRTVPSEAWHLSYTPSLDKYAKGLPQLRFGSRDKHFVPALQRKLGIKNTTTTFGPKTRSLLKAWQKAHMLTADGVCGDKTWAALGFPA